MELQSVKSPEMTFKKFPKSVLTMVEQQKENLISKTYKTPVSSF